MSSTDVNNCHHARHIYYNIHAYLYLFLRGLQLFDLLLGPNSSNNIDCLDSLWPLQATFFLGKATDLTFRLALKVAKINVGAENKNVNCSQEHSTLSSPTLPQSMALSTVTHNKKSSSESQSFEGTHIRTFIGFFQLSLTFLDFFWYSY